MCSLSPFEPSEFNWSPAYFPLCAYERMSPILKPDTNLCAILRPKCHWHGVEGVDDEGC